MINAYKTSVRTPEGITLLLRPRCRWKDNIKMNLKEIGCEVVSGIHLAQEWVL